jgi:rod shape-determining protein MreC
MLYLFLLLEGIAFFLLLQNNYIQRIAFVKATNTVSGNIHERITNWRDYLHLREQNRQLRDENTQLRSMLPGTFYMTDSSRTFYADSGRLQRYTYFSAKVIENSINKQFNFLTLDRGRKGGIIEGMAVIGPEGIVGKVHGVSEHFARVMPVINRDFRVSAKFKKNNHFGSLSWDGRSYRHATLNEIVLHVPVEKGDTLVVSGFSDSFPEGIPVGVVDKVEQKDGSFYTIDVLLATDFSKLYFVSVVEDLLKTEKQEVENDISDLP